MSRRMRMKAHQPPKDPYEVVLAQDLQPEFLRYTFQRTPIAAEHHIPSFCIDCHPILEPQILFLYQIQPRLF